MWYKLKWWYIKTILSNKLTMVTSFRVCIKDDTQPFRDVSDFMLLIFVYRIAPSILYQLNDHRSNTELVKSTVLLINLGGQEYMKRRMLRNAARQHRRFKNKATITV